MHQFWPWAMHTPMDKTFRSAYLAWGHLRWRKVDGFCTRGCLWVHTRTHLRASTPTPPIRPSRKALRCISEILTQQRSTLLTAQRQGNLSWTMSILWERKSAGCRNRVKWARAWGHWGNFGTWNGAESNCLILCMLKCWRSHECRI